MTVGAQDRRDGARPTPEDLARLRAYCHGKGLRQVARDLRSQDTTIQKLLDGFGVKPTALAGILARLP